jgi:cytochrome c-type biogenesis protein CcmF
VLTAVGAVLGLFIIISSLIDPAARLRKGYRLSPAVIGMTLAHIGVGIFVLGVTFVESATVERDVALANGQSTTLGAYVFRYEGGGPIQGPNYDGYRGQVVVTRDGREVARLTPEKRRYYVQGSTMTEASIKVGWNRDLFAALGEDVGKGAWSLRLQYRPLIRFIWFGVLLMAAGGVVATRDRRFRLAENTVSSTATAGEGAARPAS